MNNGDIELICVECKQPFIFTERDQKFYEEKGFVQPKRCKKCRIKRKNSN